MTEILSPVNSDSLNFCLLSKLKVVIIGQDPYHQQSQANGLSFSVGKDVKIPPSLNNIFKELNNDVNKPIPNNGDLTYLSKQGILLLNSCLSVRMSSPGSHYNFGWEKFTDKIISIISKKKSNVVFLLWGNKSISKSKLIDTNKHLIFVCKSGIRSWKAAKMFEHVWNNKISLIADNYNEG